MYVEEPRRKFDWTNIIKKGLLIVLVVLVIFFIVWLFTRNTNPSNNLDVDYSNNSNNNQNSTINSGTITNPDAYSESYINNYRYFHDTAKEYFLISELPENGNSLKYTLQELIDKGLIIPFSYKNNSTCDTEASYVLVTNENGTYHMSTTLVCGQEVAKTTEELGCNQLCVQGNCKNTLTNEEEISGKDKDVAIEYQFRQAYSTTESVYSCPSGYTKSGSICIKDDSSNIRVTTNVKYLCPEGYTKVGIGGSSKCIKEASDTVDPVCPNGYTKSGSGSSIKCTKTDVSSKTLTTDPVCPDGYTKYNNSMCAKETNTTKTETADFICPSGYTKSGSGANTKCTGSSTSYTTQSASPVFSYYSCSKGTNLGNGKCRVYSSSSYYKSYTILLFWFIIY